MITADIIIGLLASLLFTSVGLAIRASVVRAAGGPSYYRGWHDAIKDVKNKLEYCYPPENKLG